MAGVRYTDEELQEIVDRQLARIRRGERMATVVRIHVCGAVKRERQWKEGGGAPQRSRDVSF